LEKIPPQERFSSEELTQDLRNQGKEASCFPHTDAIIDYLVTVAEPNDIIVVMSNGGFDNIHERLLKKL
jgi:UDP-N-acetylmuramate: L-alanyl-gamma-D-glutamyl-meso-diaminopimelate ligase